MLYWLFVYPHEVCYIPEETYSDYHSEHYISEVYDKYTFYDPCLFDADKTNTLYGSIKRDVFDLECSGNKSFIDFAYKSLKDKLEVLCTYYPNALYSFILHNKDTVEGSDCLVKPHFHILFESNCEVLEKVVYDTLGCFSYKRCDFDKYGKHFVRYKRSYPEPEDKRFIVRNVAYRSKTLRYLTHEDEGKNKFHYDSRNIVANFNVVNDPEYLNICEVPAFAKFLSYARTYNLRSHWQWLEWIYTAPRSILPEKDRIDFESGKIRTDIKSYYISKSVDFARGIHKEF